MTKRVLRIHNRKTPAERAIERKMAKLGEALQDTIKAQDRAERRASRRRRKAGDHG